MAAGKAIDEQHKDCWAPKPSIPSVLSYDQQAKYTSEQPSRGLVGFDEDYDPNDVAVSRPLGRNFTNVVAGPSGLRPPGSDDDDDDYM